MTLSEPIENRGEKDRAKRGKLPLDFELKLRTRNRTRNRTSNHRTTKNEQTPNYDLYPRWIDDITVLSPQNTTIVTPLRIPNELPPLLHNRPTCLGLRNPHSNLVQPPSWPAGSPPQPSSHTSISGVLKLCTTSNRPSPSLTRATAASRYVPLLSRARSRCSGRES